MSDTHRTLRQQIATETLDILANKFYLNSTGEKIDLQAEIDFSINHSRHFRAESFGDLLAQKHQKSSGTTQISVTNETTLACAARLWAAGQRDLCALNFASAKNAGGGFINGSQAQEESLARSSALYATQMAHPAFYNIHRNLRTKLYTDNMIYSPQVPVFRDDENALLDAPYLLSIITSPAVNKGALDKRDIDKIESTSLTRIEKILSLAAHYQHNTLILGAWGCGVFRNDAQDIARYFHQKLVVEQLFQGHFERIIFAIYDNTKNKTNLAAFEGLFGK